jgi:hypothetical protein
MAKKSSKKSKAKKSRAMGMDATDMPGTEKPGVANAKKFFDLVDETPALQTWVGMNNKNILQLAREMKIEFDYEDMQEHLIKRWKIMNPPEGGFCCT